MKKSAHWAPAPNLTILTVERDETNWAVSLSGGDHAICPVCRVRSHSRHSSYRRTLRDLPAQGTPVEVRAQMTRWRCRNDRCERRIFAERIPGLAAPFARRTTRLAGIVRLFGHSAGGRPSERLGERNSICSKRVSSAQADGQLHQICVRANFARRITAKPAPSNRPGDERRPFEVGHVGDIVRRFTPHRFGKTSKPLAASERLTISATRQDKAFFCASENYGP